MTATAPKAEPHRCKSDGNWSKPVQYIGGRKLKKSKCIKCGITLTKEIGKKNRLTGWPEDRVKDALERAMANGYASFELNDDADGEG